MKASEFYNERNLIENFGKSKVFETFRRMREVWPDFPTYAQTVTEFHAAWLIFLMSKTGRSSTDRAIYNAVMAGKNLKCGDENFIIWFGNLLTEPQRIKKDIQSIWIFQDANCIQVNEGERMRIFQGETKVKTVSTATQLSAQFLFDFSMKLSETLKDENFENENVFEDEEYNGEKI